MEAEEMLLKSRAKPVQQRAQLTRSAILDAFVRLLVEQGYQKTSMRQLALLAGTGLGTVYDYFPGKASIAAYSIRQRFGSAAVQMRLSLQQSEGQATLQRVDSLLHEILAIHRVRPQEWSALIVLERQISGLAAYRELYLEILALWQQLLSGASDAALYRSKSAAVLHAMVYGLLYQTLMLSPDTVCSAQFSRELHEMVAGYLNFRDQPLNSKAE